MLPSPDSRLARSCRFLVFALGAAAVVMTARGLAQRTDRKGLSNSSQHENRNYDARVTLVPATVTPAADLAATIRQQAAIDALRKQLPDLDASIDERTGATRTIWNRVGYLTGPRSGSARDIADAYIAANLDLLGLVETDLAERELTDVVYTRVTGATHIYYRQRVNGVPVYNAQLHVNVNRDGRIISMNNGFVPNLAAGFNSLQPGLEAADAVRSAADHLEIRDAVVRGSRVERDGVRQDAHIDTEHLSTEPVRATLMLLPVRRGEARLVWNFQIHTLDDDHAFDFTVDADSRQVWTRFDWVASDQYLVYPRPSESPSHVSPAPPADGRTTVLNPANLLASPFLWHDTNGAAGAEYTILRGNNVHAYEDSDSNNTPPATQPDCGGSLNCTFVLDLEHEPTAYTAAAVANLFYWNNIVHDVQYQYGFDEPAGNFQVNNYGRGGQQNDDVRAEAQDGSGLNNANFSTPPDGARPRMQMYLWNHTSPSRDGDVDNGVIVHEYGHGISNRLVGGPSNTSCLGNPQQPGEGLSDWWSLVYTAKPGDTAAMSRGIGTYPLGQSTTAPGIRGVPYTTNTSVNNWTYESISGRSVPHGVGAVWAQAMWRVYWALVNEHGFGANLYNAGGGSGNQRAMLYVNEGLKNTACSPTFADVRDGIIQAAVDNYAGADVCRLWGAFAAFGLGTDAVSGGANSTTPTNGFNRPVACGGTALPALTINDVSVTEGNAGTTAATFTVALAPAATSEVRVRY
ncbi:MAG: M36 family metallopeptidase, partial [Vicinamibacterales bacterium]